MLWGVKMANEQNLIPFSERTESEQREICSKGGIKSGEVRREKKTFKELAKIALSAKPTDKRVQNIAKKYGIEDPDNKMLVVLGMIRAGAGGSHQALDRLLELSGEKTEDQNKDVMAKLDKVLGDIDAIANE